MTSCYACHAKKVLRLALFAGLIATPIVPAPLPAAEDAAATDPAKGDLPLLRSAASGPWSAAATWEGGQAPKAGARVQIRAGHEVVYDVSSDQVIRSIHVAGTLRFAATKTPGSTWG